MRKIVSVQAYFCLFLKEIRHARLSTLPAFKLLVGWNKLKNLRIVCVGP